MERPEHILLVDDDKLVRQTLVDMIQDIGFTVDQAESVSEALDHMAKKNYDILLTDILMPEEDGLELLRKARKDAPKAMKIIAISGGGYEGGDFYLSLARQLGADAILKKPVTLDDLRTVLKNLREI